MKRILVIKRPDGSLRRQEVDAGDAVPVNPGDEVLLLDKHGNPVEASLRPHGKDLEIRINDEEAITLSGFYDQAEGEAPVAINLDPATEVPVEYAFNSQLGNLPQGSDFTLMRLSNLGGFNFVEQFEELNRSLHSWIAEARGPDPLGFFRGDGGLGAGGSRSDSGDTYITNQEVRTTNLIANHPPTPRPDFASTDEESRVNLPLLANDGDRDGDAISVRLADGRFLLEGIATTLPSGATVTLLADGTVDYDPNGAFESLPVGSTSVDTFSYTVRDSFGHESTSYASITINGVNDPPVARDDTATTEENVSVRIPVLENDTDPDDGDSVAISSITPPGRGSVSINLDGSLQFAPGTDFDYLAEGETTTETFSYHITDGSGATATATATITITGTNDGPTAIDDTGSTDQDTATTIDVLDNDTDPDTSDSLTIIGVDQPDRGSVSINASNELVFDPGDDFDDLDDGQSATVTFDYTISDGNGGTDTATVTVTVDGAEDPTVTNPDSATTDEGSPVTIDVLDNDSDPDTNDNPLTIASVSDPAKGATSIVANEVVFDPGGDFEDLAVGESETVTFTYETNTGAIETVTVTVTGTNDDPTAVDDAESVTQGGSTNIDLLGAGDSLSADSDPDGDTLTVIQVDGRIAGGTLILTSGAALTLLADGTADYTPNGAFDYLDNGESTTDSFTYVVSDGNGGTDTATVTVVVNGADDALQAAPDRASTSENTPVTIDVLANDNDPDSTDEPLFVRSTSQPSAGSVANNTTDVTFDPGTDFDYLGPGESAEVTFSYTAENQDGATVVESATVTVNGENDGPDSYRDTLHTMEGVGGEVDVIQNDSDPDSIQITITEINGVSVNANEAVSLSAGGFVTVKEDGRIYFNPDGEYSRLGFGETATTSFTYTVEDEFGETAVESVTLVIEGADNVVTTSGAYQVLFDQLYEIVLDPNDESILYVPIGSPLPFNFNSIAFNANDNLIYANARDSDPGLGINDGDVFQIDPLTGQVVGNLGQFTNDQGESIPSFAGVINSDINVYYVNGPTDSAGNTAYAIDLETFAVTGIGTLPGADYGVDVNTGLIWSVDGSESYSLDPTSGTLTTYTHGGLQDDGVTAAGGTFGSMFADVDGNIQVTSNSGFGLYQLDTATGALTRIGDAPSSTSNDATGTRNSALPSALPYLLLDVDGSTNAPAPTDAFRSYDPDGAPVSIADTDVRIADLNGDIISSARIVLRNPLPGDTLGINGSLPGGIMPSVTSEGDLQVLTLTGDATQADYEAAISAVTFSNNDPGVTPADPREIRVTLTDIEGVKGNTASSFVFIGSGGGTIAGRDVQTEARSYPDQIVLHEDDIDPTTGGATFNLLENDSDSPAAINSITQPPPGEGTVVNNGDGTVTFRPDEDFQYLSEGETATTVFTYTSDTGQTEVVTVTVHGADDPLEALPDNGTTDADEILTVDVLANDRDVDVGDLPLSLTAVTQPAAGAVSIFENKVVFDPQGDFDYLGDGETATATFIYTVTNADGVDVNELVTITVNGTAAGNSAPSAVDDSIVAFIDRPVTLNLTSNDDDPDGDSLIVTDTGIAGNGTASIDPVTGNVIYTPQPGFTGSDSFTYTISDGEGGFDTASVDVSVLATPGNTEGVWGGHFDLDYDTSLGGDTDGHDHAYDDDYGVLGVDYFNAQGSSFSGVNDELSGGQRFKIIVANGDLSPSARISINQTYDEGDPSTYLLVTDYDDTATDDLTVFSLDGTAGTIQLTSLSIMFTETSIAEAGFLPSETGAVRDNTAGPDGEWRNGALTLQLVEVNDSGDNFTTDPSLSSGGVQGVATSGLLYESTIFWHWDEGIYDGESPYVPQDPDSVTSFLEPVVIDLDGDGTEFDGVADGIIFDVDGDGNMERTAWANQDDGVLVYDRNQNNELDDRSEFAFSDYGDAPDATDLEGLRHFDTNDDLVLDAQDDDFEKFKIWQDSDDDGQVSEGEMRTLTEVGIDSIALSHDEESYWSADGEVFVHGESEVRFQDGSLGVAADSAFRYEDLIDDMETESALEITTELGDVINLDQGAQAETPTPPSSKDDPASASRGGTTEIGGHSIEDDAAAASAALG